MATDDDVLKLLIDRPVDLSLAEIDILLPGLARRTIQRSLARLALRGDILATGAGRSRRFRAAVEISPNSEINISPAGAEIRSYVNGPLTARDPVGYQPDLLDSYLPNETHYFSDGQRRLLHNVGRTPDTSRPAGTYGRSVLDRLLIDLSWASSRLEGNTYSRIDTVALIEHGAVADGVDFVETQMILNHKAAIEMFVENIDRIGFNRYTVMNLHSVLSENLLDDQANEGMLRETPVGISASVYSPLSVPQQIEEYFDIFLDKADSIIDPFEQSIFAMVHLPYLQPFVDVNKRTSRMLANLPLIRSNLVPLTFVDVPTDAYNDAIIGVYEMGRYELLRDLYLWAYPRSARHYEIAKLDVPRPDPLRLRYRNVVRDIVRNVVLQPEINAVDLVKEQVRDRVAAGETSDVEDLVSEELRVLHPGSIARYGLRPSEFERWKKR